MSNLSSLNFIELTDSSNNIATSYNLQVNTSAKGFIDISNDVDYYRVDLIQGQTYTFALIGTGVNFLSDPILKLRNIQGNVLASNDDGGVGYSSLMTYRANQSGTYYLDIRDVNSATGQYGLSFSLGAKASFDTSMGGAAIFTDSASWGDFGVSASVTYGFRDTGTGTEQSSTFSQLTSSQMTAVDQALALWSDVANINFVKQNPAGFTNNATMLFANYSDPNDGAGAYAYTPGDTSSNSIDGDVWLNLANGVDTSVNVGDWTFETILHEIGHAIGLSHPGDYNAGPGEKITYSNSAQFLQDSNQYSVMSYFAGSYTGQYVSSSVTTPLMLDIYELQLLYGANLTSRSTDTIYGFNNNTGSNIYTFLLSDIPFFCIWDGGGNDSLDCSAYITDQNINLNATSFSSIGGGVDNISIAYGVAIENADGGNGNDRIVGNDINNYLAGNDGNDTLNGGQGDDSMVGGGGNDTYVVDSLSDVIVETDSVVATGGIDLIQTALTTYSLASINNVENLTYTSTSNATLTGNSLNNSIVGGGGHDTLDGGTGIDTLVGGLGNDTYVVDNTLDVVTELAAAGTDTIQTTLNTYSLATTLLANVENLTFTGAGNANLTGNALANTLTGSTGNDTITGGAGSDNMNGGDGNDLFMIGLATDYAASETINGGNGTDEIRLSTLKKNTVILSSNVTNVENVTIGTGTAASAISTGTLAINVNASSVGNALSITGNTGANSLTGTSYNDTLNGGLGNDVLTGGSGQDIFLFNTALNATMNKDTITDFSHSDDTIQLSKAIMAGLGSLGTLSANDFKVTSGSNIGKPITGYTAFDGSDHIIYNQTTGALYYDADGSGATAAVQVALIGATTHPTDLDYTDFVIV